MRMLKVLWLTLVVSACGAGDMQPSGSLGFDSHAEEMDERLSAADPGKVGPYTVRSYAAAANTAAYKSAIVYYPSESAGALLPATTLSGGYTNTKEQMSWLGQHLASHGIVTIVFTPTNTTASSAQIWANGHKGSLDTLVKEQARAASPLYGRLNLKRFGVSGYSYGGAGAVLAANQSPALVAAAIPLSAYQPVRPTSRIPYLFIAGTADTVASSSAILSVFRNTSTGEAKAFANFRGVTHFDYLNGGRNHESIARYATAWYLRFLGDKVEYADYLNGDAAKKNSANTSIFAKASDYIYED